MNDTELNEILDTWKTPDVPPSLRRDLRAKLPVDRTRRIFGVPARWMAAFALGAGALALATSLVETRTLGSDTGSWDGRIYVRRTRLVEPPIAMLRWMLMSGGQTQPTRLAGSRYLFDRLRRMYYGYAWKAQRLESGQYLFTVEPMDPSAVREDGPIAPLAQPPAARIVGANSAFEVDLYAQGRERVYDRIELSEQPFAITGDPEPAQKALTITLTRPKLYINGQFAAGSGGVMEAKGLTALIDAPGRGRYVLALDPQGNSRFVQAGFTDGNAIDFQAGNDRFRIECSSPVASGVRRPVFLFARTDIPVKAAGFASGGPASQYR